MEVGEIMKITFFKRALNTFNKPYDSPLGSYNFPNHVSEERAIEEAIKQFQADFKCADWKEIADYYYRE